MSVASKAKSSRIDRPDRKGCRFCGGDSSLLFEASDRNRGVTDETFRYHRCKRCECVFLPDAPDHLGRYYREEYYELPTPSGLERMAQEGAHRIELVRRHADSGRLVEIGAGVGVFAYQAKAAGFDVTAVEMDSRCCEYLASVVGVEVVESNAPEDALDALPPSRVIALWHVLEHLPNPSAVLESAAANLEPGGMLVIATPNPAAFQFRVLRARWPHIDAPRHLALIPLEALAARVAGLGLECVEITSGDPGGRYWNRFGWQRGLLRPGAGTIESALARTLGTALAAALDPFERRGLRGSTYTAVFRMAEAR